MKVNKSVRQAVLDEDGFWKPLRSCLELVTPISSALTELESDKALLSDVPEVLHSIKTEVISKLATSTLTDQEKARAKEIMSRRGEFCLRRIQVAANLVDARYRGRNLDDAQIADTFDWISKQAEYLSLDIGKLLSNLAEYRTSTGIWSRAALWESAEHVEPST